MNIQVAEKLELIAARLNEGRRWQLTVDPDWEEIELSSKEADNLLLSLVMNARVLRGDLSDPPDRASLQAHLDEVWKRFLAEQKPRR